MHFWTRIWWSFSEQKVCKFLLTILRYLCFWAQAQEANFHHISRYINSVLWDISQTWFVTRRKVNNISSKNGFLRKIKLFPLRLKVYQNTGIDEEKSYQIYVLLSCFMLSCGVGSRGTVFCFNNNKKKHLSLTWWF